MFLLLWPYTVEHPPFGTASSHRQFDKKLRAHLGNLVLTWVDFADSTVLKCEKQSASLYPKRFPSKCFTLSQLYHFMEYESMFLLKLRSLMCDSIS